MKEKQNKICMHVRRFFCSFYHHVALCHCGMNFTTTIHDYHDSSRGSRNKT